MEKFEDLILTWVEIILLVRVGKKADECYRRFAKGNIDMAKILQWIPQGSASMMFKFVWHSLGCFIQSCAFKVSLSIAIKVVVVSEEELFISLRYVLSWVPSSCFRRYLTSIAINSEVRCRVSCNFSLTRYAKSQLYFFRWNNKGQ